MSSKSNDFGRAFEYVFLITLYSKIKEIRDVEITMNSSYYAAEKSWITLSDDAKSNYKKSAYPAVEKIFDLEPRILEFSDDILMLCIQSDKNGVEGDVRDILIVRNDIKWEIGLSLKHNHFAVKHSRLSNKIDFGEKWYGIKCSQRYWSDVKPIFDYLSAEKLNNTKFSDLPDKESSIYIPLLKAFMNELTHQYESHSDIPEKMVEYLLGKFDFYKVISEDNNKCTQIKSFNLRGTLNLPGKINQSTINIPIVLLPTRIVCLDFVPNKGNTIELYMNNGWQFSMRIHNAETYVVPSLKFDIQIVGTPASIVTINCFWKNI